MKCSQIFTISMTIITLTFYKHFNITWCIIHDDATIIINTIIIIIIPIIADIHNGDNTHHQLQVMYPVSFNPINKIVSIPENPIPLDVDLLISNTPNSKPYIVN